LELPSSIFGRAARAALCAPSCITTIHTGASSAVSRRLGNDSAATAAQEDP